MARTLILEKGGTAEITETDGARVVLACSVPCPPGSSVSGTLGGADRPYRVKVRGCRRVEGEALPFRVEGRFVDLTRDQREALLG